ncbi:MAG: hypothetical protein JNJ64_07480 [Flavobacteriales bacterium]|nr:hypothetical protein [Flavobacteriales bacterium]
MSKPILRFGVTDQLLNKLRSGDSVSDSIDDHIVALKKKPQVQVVISENDKAFSYLYPWVQNGELFALRVLDPTQNFLLEAIKHHDAFDQARSQVGSAIEIDAGGIKLVNRAVGETLLSTKIHAILFYALAAEALANSRLPFDASWTNKKGETLDRQGIERWCSWKEKIDYLINHREVGSILTSKAVDFIVSLIKIRDNVVHTKGISMQGAIDDCVTHYYAAFQFDLDKTKKSMNVLMKALG